MKHKIQTAQIRVSRNLVKDIKSWAVKNDTTMVHGADFIITKGLEVVKKNK